jgi:c-di-GMP phosphodiesterase
MDTQGQAPAEKPIPFLARQPILTRDEKVLGYELLFRDSPDDRQSHSDVESGTNSIIDTLNVVGFDAVCDGRLAFINLSLSQVNRAYNAAMSWARQMTAVAPARQ